MEKIKLFGVKNDFFMAFQKGVIFLQIRSGYCVLSDYISAVLLFFDMWCRTLRIESFLFLIKLSVVRAKALITE